MTDNYKVDVNELKTELENSFILKPAKKTPYEKMETIEITQFMGILIESNWSINSKTCKFVSLEEQSRLDISVVNNMKTKYSDIDIKGGLNQLSNDTGVNEFLKSMIKREPPSIKLDGAVSGVKETTSRINTLADYKPKTYNTASSTPNIIDLAKRASKLNGGNNVGSPFGGDFLPLNKKGNIQTGGSTSCADKWQGPFKSVLTKLFNMKIIDQDDIEEYTAEFTNFKDTEKDLINKINTLISDAEENKTISNVSSSTGQLKNLLEKYGNIQSDWLSLFMNVALKNTSNVYVPFKSLVEVKKPAASPV